MRIQVRNNLKSISMPRQRRRRRPKPKPTPEIGGNLLVDIAVANKAIVKTIPYGRTEVISCDYVVHSNRRRLPLITFVNKTSDECAQYVSSLRYNRMAILNFANGNHPGGGYLRGKTAQEEDLCRAIPNLYSALDYNKKQGNYPLYSNEFRNPNTCQKWHKHLLYTSGLTLMKHGRTGINVGSIKVDVITAAAVNCGNVSHAFVNSAVYKWGVKRSIMTILSAPLITGLTKKTHVDVLILGAWGCGVFKNDAYLIANEMVDAIMVYGGYYKHIFLAIPNPSDNSNVFRHVFASKNIVFNTID